MPGGELCAAEHVTIYGPRCPGAYPCPVVEMISVVLPAFNERESLGPLLPELVAVLESIAAKYEVLVVDDGSTDGTRAAVKAMAIPGVRCVRLRRNSGKAIETA